MSNYLTYMLIAGVVLNAAAQIITIITPTPDPNSKIGKVYRIIEVLAGLVGKAKQGGDVK